MKQPTDYDQIIIKVFPKIILYKCRIQEINRSETLNLMSMKEKCKNTVGQRKMTPVAAFSPPPLHVCVNGVGGSLNVYNVYNLSVSDCNCYQDKIFINSLVTKTLLLPPTRIKQIFKLLCSKDLVNNLRMHVGQIFKGKSTKYSLSNQGHNFFQRHKI